MTQIPTGMEVFDLKFLLIINAFLYQTGIPQQFDDQVELQAHVRPGVWIALMILDTLNGRSALYHLSEYASTIDSELLFGQHFEPEAFDDDADGRCKTGKEVLVAYKEQHGVEQNDGFLKDPVIVNSLILKKPERMEALGVVLLLSLMVWRLIEKVLRRLVNESNETPMRL